MGLLNRMQGMAGKPMQPGMGGFQTPGYGGQSVPQPPQLQPMGQGMPGAFGGNPQFMAQLQQMMAMQPFKPPPRVGMPTSPLAPFTGGGMGGMGATSNIGTRPSAMGLYGSGYDYTQMNGQGVG